MPMKPILFVALVAFVLYYALSWVRLARRSGVGAPPRPTAAGVGIGFVTNFFDTLGIGSFATTTSLWKFFKVIDDRVIPGTLNVGHTPAVVTQAFIFIAIIQVDARTLACLIAAAVLGAWLGAGVVARWSRTRVRVGMGTALIAAAGIMTATQLQLLPGGGVALGLTGAKLLVAMSGNFVLGALMSLGIGLYAPSMIMISLLGMSPTTAFPIMMGSCAFLMPVAAVKFVREGSYDLKAAVGLTAGGVPAVLIGAFLVKSLSLTTMRWLVIVVVLYTAALMLRSAVKERRATAAATADEGAAS